MRKRHSDALKLAAVFLAQQSSVDGAAESLGIDPRTIRGWQETVTLPGDKWEAIRDVLLARGGEMAAKGDTRGLQATLTGAGIAERNVRYGKLIQQRDARRSGKVAQDDAAEKRWRRDRIRRELDPDPYFMPEHHTDGSQRSDAYLAAHRRLEYCRQSREALVHRHALLEAKETGREVAGDAPLAAEHIGQLGIYYLLRCAADTSPDTDHTVDAWHPPGYEGVTTASLAALTDDDYRAFYGKLLGALQAEADAWWPHYTAELHKGVIAERRADGTLRILREGRDVTAFTPMRRVPYEYEGIPVIDVGPAPNAKDVTPPQRLETSEEPRPRAESPPRPAESLVVDLDHDRGWKEYYRGDL